MDTPKVAADANAVASPNEPPKSKRQLKREAKAALWAAGKAERRFKEKQRRKRNKAREREEQDRKRQKLLAEGKITTEELEAQDRAAATKRANGRNRRLRCAELMGTAPKVVIDMSWDAVMQEKEIKSLAQQLKHCYTANIGSDHPVNYFVTSLAKGNPSELQLAKNSYTTWAMHHTPLDYMRYFGRDCDQHAELECVQADRARQAKRKARVAAAAAAAEAAGKTELLASIRKDHADTVAGADRSGEGAKEPLPAAAAAAAASAAADMKDDAAASARSASSSSATAAPAAPPAAPPVVSAEEHAARPLTDDERARARERLVFLTAESDNVLGTLDPDKIYIIGGIVDHNRMKGAADAKANKEGLSTARLPIQEHMEAGRRSVITVNQVFDMLVGANKPGFTKEDWPELLSKVLPPRWKWKRQGQTALGDEDGR